MPDKRISGRIKKNRDSGSGAAITVDGSALRYALAYRVRDISGYEKIPQSNTERGMIDMSDFELLSLVVMTANLIVQILIYIKKK